VIRPKDDGFPNRIPYSGSGVCVVNLETSLISPVTDGHPALPTKGYMFGSKMTSMEQPTNVIGIPTKKKTKLCRRLSLGRRFHTSLMFFKLAIYCHRTFFSWFTA
jgi:hypothetical protein